MFGVLGAYFAYYYKVFWIRYKVKLLWVGLSIVLVTQLISIYISQGSHITQPGFGLYLSVFSFTIVAIGILLLLPFLSEYKVGKGKVFEAVTSISIASYSIYLIHASLIQPFVYNLIDVNNTSHTAMITRYVLYWVLTIGCSILLYNSFEKPTTNLRERIVRKSSSNLPK
jgi:peptidoglycan/LPS O-acetylase OafA/YrhL